MTQNCKIIKGAEYADKLYAKLHVKLNELAQHNITPGLAVILLGNDAASLVYVKNKVAKAEELGVKVTLYHLSEDTSTRILLNKIEHLNNDIRVHGILVQLPLPPQIDADEIINAIAPEKDVDGFHVQNVGKLALWQECLQPCTPQGIVMLLRDVFKEQGLAGKKAVIIGRSRIVGRPLAAMLVRENCTVTIMHSHTKNPEQEARTADILISATGQPNLVKADWVKPLACVIDVGIIRIGDKLYGDVDFAAVQSMAAYITPVPGGVGPMTVACMLANTIKATCMQKKMEFMDLSHA